jgi:hypothetical protein
MLIPCGLVSKRSTEVLIFSRLRISLGLSRVISLDFHRASCNWVASFFNGELSCNWDFFSCKLGCNWFFQLQVRLQLQMMHPNHSIYFVIYASDELQHKLQLRYNDISLLSSKLILDRLDLDTPKDQIARPHAASLLSCWVELSWTQPVVEIFYGSVAFSYCLIANLLSWNVKLVFYWNWERCNWPSPCANAPWSCR